MSHTITQLETVAIKNFLFDEQGCENAFPKQPGAKPLRKKA